MPRPRVEFLCRECGYRNPRSLGRCPECDAWGSFDETTQAAAPTPLSGRIGHVALAAKPVRLSEMASHDFHRIPLAMQEFARVLGGGIVKGSLTLVGGDPGVGKSTLLTQVADQVATR